MASRLRREGFRPVKSRPGVGLRDYALSMVRVALAQINTVVGDIDGNTARILEAIGRAEAARAHVVAVPELAITGYPPEDLVLKRPFVEENRAALDAIAAGTGATIAVVGFVQADEGHLYN